MPTWPSELEVTPDELLRLVVDLNGRYHGAFHATESAMHEDLDRLWND